MNRFLLVAGSVLALAVSSMAQMNTNWKHGSDRTKCDDLQITSEEYEIARGEQQFNITDAKQLNVEGSKNGGIYVTGWDQPGYSVTACKVGFAESADKAKQTLAAINVSRNGSQILSQGPEDSRWAVHYIIRVPRNGDLTASTHNGPVDARDVDAKLNLHSHNGPVSIRRCNGSITGETQNGPVSYTGKSGTINLSTVNGPVDVMLESTQWDGELSATTRNGPVSLRLPENFSSAFLVEGGFGPMSCSNAICEKATRVNERGNRRIEFGTDPKVKASTHNGPVSVATLRGDT